MRVTERFMVERYSHVMHLVSKVVGTLRADLSGVVVDAAGHVTSGVFVAGANPVFATFEVTLEEWLPEAA